MDYLTYAYPESHLRKLIADMRVSEQAAVTPKDKQFYRKSIRRYETIAEQAAYREAREAKALPSS